MVTVQSITKVDGPQRVYNLEVASLDGQITHDYFVGEDEIWTHNVQRGAGPSGKPKLHFPRHSTRKKAKDAARHKPGAKGSICHASPRKGIRHFHSTNACGCIIKDGVHNEF